MGAGGAGRNEDAPVLSAASRERRAVEDLAAYTSVLEGDPNNPLRHDAVGDAVSATTGGRRRRFRIFASRSRLNGDSAPTHYN